MNKKMKNMVIVPKGQTERVNSESGVMGECATVVNMRESEESLSVTGAWKEVCNLQKGERIVCVHSIDDKHYIYASDDKCVTQLGYRQDGVMHGWRKQVLATEGTVKWVQAMGDVLVVATTEGMRYLKTDDGECDELDEEAVMPKIVFGTVNVGEMKENVAAVKLEGQYDSWKQLTPNDHIAVQKAFADARNRMSATAHAQGGYVQPISVRYAVRMKDDRCAWISAPVVIGNGIQMTDRVRCEVDRNSGVCGGAVLTAKAYNVGMAVVDYAPGKWMEMIKSVDVLVGEEVSAFDGNRIECVCEESLVERSLACRMTTKEALVGVAQMVNPEKWRVLTTITDVTSLADGNINVVNAVPVLNGGVGMGGGTVALAKTDFFTGSIGRDEAKELSFGMGKTMVPETALTVGGRLYVGANRYVMRNLWHSTQWWGAERLVTPCEIIVSAYYHIGKVECVKVNRYSCQYTPSCLNAMIAYPDERVERMEVKVLCNGRVSEWEGQMVACAEQGYAFFVSKDYRPITLEEGVAFYEPTERDEGLERENEMVVTCEGNVWTREQRRTIGHGKVLAIAGVRKPLYSSVFGRYPVYAFTTEGVWAVSYKIMHDYADAQMVDRRVIGKHKSVVAGEGKVWWVSDDGVLCELAGKDVREVKKVGDVAWLCRQNDEKEIVMGYEDNSVMVMREKSGRCYERTTEVVSVCDDGRNALVVTTQNKVLDVNKEEKGVMTKASFETHPIEVENGEMIAPVRLSVNVSAEETVEVQLLGSDGTSDEWNEVCKVQAGGGGNRQTDVRLYARPCRLLKVRMDAPSIGSAIVRPIKVVYKK